MWEVSVPSWDEPSNEAGTGQKKDNKKKATSAVNASEEFKVVSAALHGSAVAQVERAIDEAKKKKKRRGSQLMDLEIKPVPAASEASTAAATPKKRKRGSRGGKAKKALQVKDKDVQSEEATPVKRARGVRGGAFNRAKRANAIAKAAAGGSEATSTSTPDAPAAAAADGDASPKPPRKKAKKEEAEKPQTQQPKATAEAATPTATPQQQAPRKAKSQQQQKKKAEGEEAAPSTDSAAAPNKQQQSPANKKKQQKAQQQPQQQQQKKTKPADAPEGKSDGSAQSPAKLPAKAKGAAATTEPQSPAKPQAQKQQKQKQKQKKGQKKQNTTASPTSSAETPKPAEKAKKTAKSSPAPSAAPAASEASHLDQLLMEHLGKAVAPVASPASTTPVKGTPAAEAKRETKQDKAKQSQMLKRLLLEAEQRDTAKPAAATDATASTTNGGKRKQQDGKRPTPDKKNDKRQKRDKAPATAAGGDTNDDNGDDDGEALDPDLDAAGASKRRLSELQRKMMARLSGSRFRWINEQFYTTTGAEALRLVKKDPAVFEEYHKGFARQVQLWPENPVDIFIAQLKAMPKTLRVADMGCGDAKIAQSVEQKVHSFDLASPNKWVTACDISRVPLGPQSVDVVIFCLSLMGTNLTDFVKEAYRILTNRGTLKIAEVKSRFEDINKFVGALYALGFDLVSQDDHNKMFVLFDFKKSNRATADKVNLTLKPCIYKKR